MSAVPLELKTIIDSYRGEGPPALRVTRPETLGGLMVPTRQWLIPDWVPWHQTTLLYGDGGTGKSLLAQQLCTTVTVGLPWCGMGTKQVNSLGVFCEDSDDELHIRQAAINASLGIRFADLSGFCWLSRVGLDNLLMVFNSAGVGELRPFWHQLREQAFDEGSRLVVLDTAADLFGGNENDRSHVRQFLQGGCTRLAREIDGVVLLCAHPSRSGMATESGDGGSTGWSNSARSRLYLTRPKETEESGAGDNERFLDRVKSNYGPRKGRIPLQWHEGSFRLSGSAPSDAGAAIERASRARHVDGAFLAALRVRNAQLRPVSASPNAGTYAPKVFAKSPECPGMSEKELGQAMDRLFNAGLIRADQPIGRHEKRRHTLSGIAEVLPEERPNASNDEDSRA